MTASKHSLRVRLTDRLVATYKTTVQADLRDLDCRGLVLKVSPGGTKSWSVFCNRRADGKRTRLPLGHYPAVSLGKARTAARNAREAAKAGLDPVGEAEAGAVTVAALVEDFLTRHASVKRTAPEIRRRLRKNLVAHIGGLPIANLRRRHLVECVDRCTERGAPIEARRVFEDVRKLARWAVGKEILPHNLMDGAEAPPVSKERERVLSPREIHHVWHALPGTGMSQTAIAAVRLLLLTGQRVSEVCGTPRAELDLDEGWWQLPSSRTKNGRPHWVPLAPLAVSLIREQIASADAASARKGYDPSLFVFPGRGELTPLAGTTLPQIVQRTATGDDRRLTIGLPHWVPHDLRRTCATGMTSLGVPQFVVGHILNHASTIRATVTGSVYDRYSYGPEKMEAARKWSEHIATIIAADKATLAKDWGWR